MREEFERTIYIVVCAVVLALAAGGQPWHFSQKPVPAKADAHVIRKPAKRPAHHVAASTPKPAPALKPAAVKVAATGYTFAAKPSWSQNFAIMPNSTLNNKYWNFDIGNNDGWGNNEAEYYTSRLKNAHIAGGNLMLTARAEQYKGYSYTSARINTEGKFDFTYGRLQIIAKLPEGAGIWPAIWLWPTGNKYSSEPLTASEQTYSWLTNGEIDMLEGQAQGDNQFSASAHSVLHYPGNSERTGYVNVANATTKYHTYGLDWTPDSLTFSVDGKPFYVVNNPHTSFQDWPYDQQYHLILNVALGGSMSQNLIQKYPPDGVNSADSPWTMDIKSINYYPLKST